MSKNEVIKQLDAMEIKAKELIDTGVNKSSFMLGISDAAAKMAGENLGLAGFIIAEAKIRISNIAKYAN